MTKDTYLRRVKSVLAEEPEIKLHDSNLSKLSALGRQVESGTNPLNTIDEIEALFSPWFGRKLREALQRVLR